MYQFYSASVVGSLLVEKPRYITTPQDVLDSNLAVGSEDIAYNHDFFAVSQEKDHKLSVDPIFPDTQILKTAKCF